MRHWSGIKFDKLCLARASTADYLFAMHYKAKHVEIAKASAGQKPLLARLMQFYLYDFSELATLDEAHGDLNDDGEFHCEHFDSYWTDPDREPLLINLGQKAVGFALINSWSASGLGTENSIAEFFILRKYRRARLGTRAATKIIGDRPGQWEIPIALCNQPALEFWRSVVLTLQDWEFEEIKGDGNRWSGTVLRGNRSGVE